MQLNNNKQQYLAQELTPNNYFAETERYLKQEEAQLTQEPSEFTQQFKEELQEFFNNDRSIFNAPLKSSTPTYKDFE